MPLSKNLTKSKKNRVLKIAEANMEILMQLYSNAHKSGLVNILKRQPELEDIMSTPTGMICTIAAYSSDRFFRLSDSKLLKSRKCECGISSYTSHCPFCGTLLIRSDKK